MRKLRIISFVVVGYMLAALVWWSILLYRNNLELYKTKLALIASSQPNVIPQSTEEFKLATDHYTRQGQMILGEGVVFGILLLIGIYFIQRVFTKELAISKQQNNFLLAITHELKSPLTSINLGLETIIKRPLGHDMVKEIAESSLSESNRLKSLIEDLLLTTKLDTAQNKYNKEVFDLSAFVTQFLSRIEQQRNSAIINESIVPNLRITGDKEALQSVLSNLLENAIKYGEGKPIDIKLENQQGMVILSIKDQGIGIPVNEHSHIFNKFYRVGNEETRKSKGTGLGLYICKRIVSDHQGSISVGANQPKGSIFEVKLPKVEA